MFSAFTGGSGSGGSSGNSSSNNAATSDSVNADGANSNGSTQDANSSRLTTVGRWAIAPTSNLLAVPLKQTQAVSTALRAFLTDYISHNYAEPVEVYRDDLRILQELRQDCAGTAYSSMTLKALERITRYYGQLTFIMTKFPIDVGVSFPWFGIIAAAIGLGVKPYAQPNINYERACVLFNVAAAYSHLGVLENRTSPEGLKRACAHFQSAAGVYRFMRLGDEMSDMRCEPPSDMSTWSLRALELISLAQAQECVWLRAVIDNFKDGLVARLAAQVADHYQHAYEAASHPSISVQSSRVFPRSWHYHLQLKQLHFSAVAQRRKADECLSQNKYGEEVARLRLAFSITERALSLAKQAQSESPDKGDYGTNVTVSEAVINDLKSLHNHIATNLVRAEKDNDIIYLIPVPEEGTLTAIAKADMVKPSCPDIIRQPGKFMGKDPASIIGLPLFSGLVPFAIHQAASVYTDRKDNWVKTNIIEALDSMTAQFHSTMDSLGLPEALDTMTRSHIGLPSSLLVRATEVRSDGGIQALRGYADTIRQNVTSIAAKLDECESVLRNESADDARFRKQFGDQRWQRLPSDKMTTSFREEISRYRATLDQAKAGDATISTRLETWGPLIAVLGSSREELERSVPALGGTGPTSLQSDANHSEAISTLRELLQEAKVMDDERKAAIEEARQLAADDDIGQILNEHSSRLAARAPTPIIKIDIVQFEPMFAERIASRYGRFKQYVVDELDAQNELAETIQSAHSTLLEIRKQHPLLAKREQAIKNLQLAYEKYAELTNNMHEGIKFYDNFGGMVDRLLDNCRDYALARALESKDLLSDIVSNINPSR
ncbi:BRO1-domain-containing protein [Ramicandelaber brevisporus]|nr:BRO1-domain-containing protein [Ramicandelaber brevisporus]